MASDPIILDSQTLKRLPIPALQRLSGMPSVNPLPAMNPGTLRRLNPFLGASQDDQSPGSVLPFPAPLAGGASGPRQLSRLPDATNGTDPASLNTSNQLQRLQTEQKRLNITGDGISQIRNPLLRGLARVGDVLESSIVPGAAMATPGTAAHHQMLLGQNQSQIDSALGDQQTLSQTRGFDLANAAEPQKAADASAQSQAQTGLYNAQTRRALIPPVATIKYSTAGLPESADDGHGHLYLPTDQNLPAQIKQMFEVAKQNYDTNTNKTLKPLSQQDADSRNAIWNGILAKHHLPLNQFAPGMSSSDAAQIATAFNNVISKGQGDTHVSIDLQGLQNRQNQQNANNTLDITDPAMQASVAAVAHGDMKLSEVFGRGATTALKAQFVAAVKGVNPQYNSGDHDIENKVRQYMTSGQGGSTLTAGNTLTHHLELYDHAVDAVHNGDSRTLNAIANQLGVQLGSNAQTNLALIRQGVAMEAARFWTGGIPGEAEVNQFNSSLSGDGSPQQMHGGAATVRAMARGKLQGLQGQSETGATGQPNFGQSNLPPSSGGKAHSLATAMALPFNKGKSADQVTADLKANGYTVVP